MTVTQGQSSFQRTHRMRAVSIGVGTLLAAVLLYYALRGIEWRQVAHIVARAEPSGLALAAGIATATLFLRACRWRILLNAEGTVTVSTVFWATAVGYFGNNFLPARAGEIVRTLMISSRSGLEKTYVLATALSERVADAVALVFISAMVMLTLPTLPGWFAAAGRPFAILGLLGALGIAILPLLGPVVHATIERLQMPGVLRGRLITAVEHGLRGVLAFHDARRLSHFTGLTVLIWSLDALGTMTVAAALGFRFSISLALLLMAGLGLGSALPSTPGYVGIYQFAAVTVLTPFGFSRADAIAYILVAQALMYVVIGFWGSLGLWRYVRTRPSTSVPGSRTHGSILEPKSSEETTIVP
jgi:glycosyltransferase 2 family protein